MRKKVSVEEAAEYIKLYQQGKSAVEIGKLYNRRGHVITKKLRSLGITLRDRATARRKIILKDERCFQFIDTQEKAYWLGWMFADGFVSGKSNNIKLKLAIKDLEIMEKFSNFIYGYSRVKFYNSSKPNEQEQCYIEFGNKWMKQDLIALGCIPNKSLILQLPNYLEEDLFRHFLRGFFDGDGSIVKSQANDYHINFTSSIDFCQQLKSKIDQLLSLYSRVDICHNTYAMLLMGGNRKVLKLLNWLYQDAEIYLERKYQRYQNLVTQCQQIDIKYSK